MLNTRLKNILIALLLITTSSTIKAENHPKENSSDELYNPVPAIMHHISDAHEWHLWGEGENSVTIPLPVILYTKGNLDVFMSSEFNHGYKKVKRGDRVYSIDSHSHIIEESGLHPLDLSITKNVASMLLALVVLLLLFAGAGRKSKNSKGSPKGILSYIEPLVLFVRDDIVKPNVGSNYKKFLPYLLTLFFFILINNLLGLLPGSANVTGNIAITLVLSFVTLLVTNFSANKSYWGHIFKPPGVPLALMPIMIPIEIVGIFTKPFALMIRLFANISAGHIIILSLISLIFMAQSGLGNGGAFGVAPVSVLFVLFMYLIEVLVAFLQAYIFTLLTSLFIGLATVDHH
ncbi:MAG: ATP synthase F0 subunit A [Flavobacteriales bacterium]|nr:ATP synthase F0 subunit A [Flavobacteriales bacterium]MDG1718287.1 F0F1 ATP synthase subunit A [Flavobacteriales bacterium]|tara:strand:+ start:1297 stop:2337 length:1041 start_codon:yes stop_codon:yes gene_type:complete